MKVQIIADTHGSNIQLRNDVDAIFLLGDNSGGWMWDLHAIKKRGIPVISVLGNHDEPETPAWYPWIEFPNYTEIGGFRIGCISGCIKRINENCIGHTQDQYAALIKKLSPCDIILSHAPPSSLWADNGSYNHQGIAALREYIEQENPLYCFTGHLHQQGGAWIGKTRCISVYPSIVIDLAKRHQGVASDTR